MKGTLDGLKVLDLSRLLAGPFCTMLLADLGAEIIKVESPGRGDDSRAWGPFKENESLYFASVNRGKKSIIVDMKTPEGKEIIKRIAKECDVVIENFRNGVMDRLGLGYETLKALNPGLIYCQITGYGQNGPDANRAGNDLPLQAGSGVMSITGYDDMPPVRVGISICDLATGLFSTVGILFALYRRKETGVGNKINCSLMESMVALLAYHCVGYMNAGVMPKKAGSGMDTIAPYGAFEASDGAFVLGVGNDKTWHSACKVLGISDLADDERFATNPKRCENKEELHRILHDVLKDKKRSDVVKAMVAEGVPCSEIKNVAEVCADEQMLYRKMFEMANHTKIKDLKLIRSPIEFENGTNFSEKAPPLHGEDTKAVLQEFGYSEDDIASLSSAHVVY